MDEQKFKREMLLLAEPLQASPRALDAVTKEIAAKRRKRRINAGLGAIVFLLCLAAVIAYVAGGPTTVQPTGPREIEIATSADHRYGISILITVSYAEDRVLSPPSVRIGAMIPRHVDFFPLDGIEHGIAPYPLTFPAGTKAYYSAYVKPDCAQDRDSPKIEFTIPASLPSGQSVVDTLVPSNPEAYRAAYRLYCNVGITLQATSYGSVQEDVARVELVINNGSKHHIRFDIPSLTSGGATWKALTATVPAGHQVTLVAVGSGVTTCHPQAFPWAAGRILVNGKPAKVPVVDAISYAGLC